MEDFIYALEERIGDINLFCGRKREMDLLLEWIDLIPNILIMIDEMQYMLKYLYLDRGLTNQAQRVPGAFHGLELKYAPMLVSGSYVGWMSRMMQEIFVGGRLKHTPISLTVIFSSLQIFLYVNIV